MRRITTPHVLLTVVVVLGIILAIAFAVTRWGGSEPSVSASWPTASPAAATSPELAALPTTDLDQDTIARVAAQARPGIVQITSEQQALQAGSTALVPTGVGTGFVIDGHGHILTNDRGVAQAQQLQVQMTDGRTFPATLVGRDPTTDLAVVQVAGQDLPPVPLGDSDALAAGQWVVAIGNALSGGPTVTQGVISALGRTVQEPGGQPGQAGPFLFDVIQTDAAIYPGKSGGTLLNLDAQLVGINTLSAGAVEPGIQAQGVSLAIAINTALQIADQLISAGRIEHAYLGVASTPNTPALAARFGLPNVLGLVIAQVASGSPAAQVGLQSGEVVTAVDGTPLAAESDLARILAQHRPGDVVTLAAASGGSYARDVAVRLGTTPS